MAKILNSKSAIEHIEQEIEWMKKTLNGKKPKLGVVMDEAPNEGALSYLRQIKRNAEKYGAEVAVVEIKQSSAVATIRRLQRDKDIWGMMLLSEYPEYVRSAVEPILDLDCASKEKLGNLYTATGEFIQYVPITAEAAYRILELNDISIESKRVGIVGRSQRVGRPFAEIILQKNGTPTIYHSHSDLTFLKNEDIIVSAIGKPKHLTGELFREGQVIVDVGINLDEDGKLCGDVDFNSAIDAIGDEGAITPVPGGVGTLTSALLFHRLFFNAGGTYLCAE